MIIKRYLFGEEFEVPSGIVGSPVYPSTFLIPPGYYTNGGGAWDMREPGLYLMFNESTLATGRRAVGGW